MSPSVLVATALLLPLLGIVLVFATGRSPNVRETCSLTIASLTFAVNLLLARSVFAGETAELVIMTWLPGLQFRMLLEPLGMIFAWLHRVCGS